MHLISNQTDTTGKMEHVEYTAKLDGKEYPVKTNTTQPPTIYDFAKTNQSTYQGICRSYWHFTIKGQDVLSEDGKSFSRIVNSKDANGNDTSIIQFFEKQ